MSRNLPSRPNLEYLKNEAKDRLDDLRRADPRAQLADAQFALAQEYGFASWPKLKEHVDALAAAWQHPLAGAWVANVAQSKRHPANQFRSARIHFTVRGNTVEIVDEFVDESGKPVRGRHTLEADGVERAGSNGYAVAASFSARGLETVATRDGQVIGRSSYAVSADGRTLTIADASGGSLIVLDRV
ncbi:MAG: hypothetical protein K2Y23_22530 [Cyanobacteria bacterium]|nr:hypothetical protein [Cyanobacteriota bacterium]